MDKINQIMDQMFEYWLDGYKSMFKYSGKATRKQFGFFVFVQFVLFFLIGYQTFFPGWIIFILTIPFYIIALFATLSYTARRLHDIGHNGWFCLIYILPIFNSFLLVYCLLAPQGELKPEVEQIADSVKDESAENNADTELTE